MSGTMITSLKLVKVTDGDTVRVRLANGEEESLRLISLDTEEVHAGSKPVTEAGRRGSKFAKDFFGVGDDGVATTDIHVDIEFDTDDPVDVALNRHRGNFGRLICYIYKDGVNYNQLAIEKGWSPYFVKYGRSRLYHGAFLAAEAAAQANNLGIWDPATNGDGARRDYASLIPWWTLRDSAIQVFRQHGEAGGALSVRLDYEELKAKAGTGAQVSVFCDLQKGFENRQNDGAAAKVGSPQHKFNLWLPDRLSPTGQKVLRLVSTRYAGRGRGYAFVTGQISTYPPGGGNILEIVLESEDQISDTV